MSGPQDVAGEGPRLGWVGIGISAVALLGVVLWATRQDPPQLPHDPSELAALGAAVVVYAVATLVRGERWWWMLRQEGVEVGRTDAYCLLTVGYMGNTVLPARGGDAIRVYLMSRVTAASIRQVLGTLVAERILDAVVLFGIFVLLAFGLLRGIEVPGEDHLLLLIGIGAAIVAIAAIAVAIVSRHQRGRKAVDFLAPIAGATRDLRGRYGLGMVGLTVALWVIEALEILAIGDAIGFEMSFVEALYLLVVAGLFLLIPSGPGHLGALEAGAAFGVRAVGGTGSQAVSFLILMRFVLFIPITIAGLILLVVRYGGLETIRAARAGAGQP